MRRRKLEGEIDYIYSTPYYFAEQQGAEREVPSYLVGLKLSVIRA